MVRHGNSKAAAANASDLVNFHFSSSPPFQSHVTAAAGAGAANTPSRQQQHQCKNRNKQQQYRRSNEDRASARRKAASAMFYLHSSADHAFVITRCCSKQQQGGSAYTFAGSDEPVSWDAVRTVKCLVMLGGPGESATTTTTSSSTSSSSTPSSQETCPICLDSFVCPRITKCGHNFCLACLLRHVHTQMDTCRSQAVKCPCCSLPLHMEDLRLVVFEAVPPLQIQQPQSKVKLVKLHRSKDCPAPYLPQRGSYQHLSCHAAPTAGSDPDAAFCRFNYVNPSLYQSQLATNQVELESVLEDLHQQQRHDEMELIFVQMALETVKSELRRAIEEEEQEETLSRQYRQLNAGFYQPIPQHVLVHEALLTKSHGEDTTNTSTSSTGTRPSRSKSICSEDSRNSRCSKRESRTQTLETTMYLDQETTHFYQSADGQLFFLSRFNMTCLSADFSANLALDSSPSAWDSLSPVQARRLLPFPDAIEGNVLDKESVHLTADVRKRMPFLSHLPLYTDIQFVELDLNRILSPETKEKFKGEMEKRRKRRKSKATAEKRADRLAKDKEEARINELKSRIQRIDPNDEFFRAHAAASEEPATLTGEDFGPVLSLNTAGENDVQRSSSSSSPSPRPVVQPQSPPLSFRSAIVATMQPGAKTEEAFPSLSSAPPAITENRNSKPTWNTTTAGWHGRPRVKSVNDEEVSPDQDVLTTCLPQSTNKGKKSKGKKVVLFSTGGHRGAD